MGARKRLPRRSSPHLPAMTGSTITKEGEGYIIGASVLLGKCQSGPGANLSTHDAVASKERVLDTKEVHAASLSLGTTCSLAIQFGHAALGADAFGNGQAMVAVTGHIWIFQTGGGHATGGNGFLPHIGMKKPADLSFHLVFFLRHQFKLADQLHQFVPVEVGFF